MSDLITKCSICDALVDEEDLFCANCGTEAPDRSSAARQRSRVSTHNFRCEGCGASMSYDPKAGSLRCPFCGSQKLRQQADGKVLAPHWVVPFRVERDQAVENMRGFLGRGFWRPGDLAGEAAVVNMTAVYVPYWVFRARTHTYWTADSSDVPFSASGDWMPLAGEHHGEYACLLVGASGALTPAETHALCPFDMRQAVSPEDADLENVTVEQFTVMRKYARPQARNGLETLEMQACEQYVLGRCRNLHVNVRVEGLAGEPVLLPVWIMAYRYKEKVFRFLVNGQSGKAHGEAPLSVAKMAVASMLAVVGAILLLWMLLGWR